MARPLPSGPLAPLRRLALALALLTGALALPAPAGATTTAWADVPHGYWAKPAIDFVAHTHSWMEDYGATQFKPDVHETRKYLARAMFRTFAPGATVDPSIHFDDMSSTDPFYRYANVAVHRHWIPQAGSSFLPNQRVTMIDVHRALVRALGLWDVAQGMNRFHTTDGYTFHHPAALGVIEVGMLLGLRTQHADPSLDVHPTSQLRRSEVAWSLYRAYVVKTQDTWEISSLEADGFENIHVGAISPAMRKVVEFGLKYVGYPYIYAAEWGSATPAGYCCGPQVTGGFDCSGLTWWLMKAPAGGYDNTKIRRYQGWPLLQRSSMDMATVGKKLTYREARSGDLMLYSSDGTTIDHVDLYLGYGWALDSSSGLGGVVVLRVADGWYRQHFVHARRIVTS